MKKSSFTVDMDCASCLANIRRVLKNDVDKVEANVPLQLIEVTHDEGKISAPEIARRISKAGFNAQLAD